MSDFVDSIMDRVAAEQAKMVLERILYLNDAVADDAEFRRLVVRMMESLKSK